MSLKRHGIRVPFWLCLWIASPLVMGRAVTFTPTPLLGAPGVGKGMLTGDKAQPLSSHLDLGRMWGRLGATLGERPPRLWKELKEGPGESGGLSERESPRIHVQEGLEDRSRDARVGSWARGRSIGEGDGVRSRKWGGEELEPLGNAARIIGKLGAIWRRRQGAF